MPCGTQQYAEQTEQHSAQQSSTQHASQHNCSMQHAAYSMQSRQSNMQHAMQHTALCRADNTALHGIALQTAEHCPVALSLSKAFHIGSLSKAFHKP